MQKIPKPASLSGQASITSSSAAAPSPASSARLSKQQQQPPVKMSASSPVASHTSFSSSSSAINNNNSGSNSAMSSSCGANGSNGRVIPNLSGKFSSSLGATSSSARTTPRKGEHRDHSEWLHISSHITIEPHDIEQQSLRSAVLEPNKKKMIEELVQSQKINAHSHRKESFLAPGNNEQVDSSLDENTSQSDDGVLSDKTAPAVYMTSQGGRNSLSTSSNIMQVIDLSLLRILTDEQLEKLNNYVNHEKESRKGKLTGSIRVQPVSDQAAIDARKDIKRSKSAGGSDGMNKTAKSPLSNGRRNFGLEFKDLTVVDSEDPEVRSAFDNISGEGSVVAPSSPAAHFNHSPAVAMVTTQRTASRTNGVYHPGDKMFVGLSPLQSNISPAVHKDLPIPSPAKFLGSSPTTDCMNNSHSNPNSRPHSRMGGISHGSNEEKERSKKFSIGESDASRHRPSDSSVPKPDFRTIDNIPRNGTLGLDEYFAQEKVNRERLDPSPFSAFGDPSVGSQSLCSSRSSNTRKMYENGNVDIGSPTSTFSKRLSGGNGAKGRKGDHTKRSKKI